MRRVKVSGLCLPAEMASYTLNGCAPEFALWSFTDRGYLTYYATYLIASGQMEAKEGVTFEARCMGTSRSKLGAWAPTRLRKIRHA